MSAFLSTEDLFVPQSALTGASAPRSTQGGGAEGGGCSLYMEALAVAQPCRLDTSLT